MSKDLIERLGAAAVHSEMGRKPDQTSIFRMAAAEIERLQADLDAANKREAKDYLDLLDRYEAERAQNVRAANLIAELAQNSAELWPDAERWREVVANVEKNGVSTIYADSSTRDRTAQ